MRSVAVASAVIALGGLVFAAVPRPAPALDLVDSTGKHISLESLKGKVVVVQFLLTTCPHCQAFSKLLNNLQAEYGPKGFQAVGAGFNEVTQPMAAAYHAQYAQAFPVGAVPEATVESFMQLSVMDRWGAPQIAVIDRKGMIVEQSSPRISDTQPLQQEPHLRQLVEKLLAEPAGAAGAVSSRRAPHGAVAAAKK